MNNTTQLATTISTLFTESFKETHRRESKKQCDKATYKNHTTLNIQKQVGASKSKRDQSHHKIQRCFRNHQSKILYTSSSPIERVELFFFPSSYYELQKHLRVELKVRILSVFWPNCLLIGKHHKLQSPSSSILWKPIKKKDTHPLKPKTTIMSRIVQMHASRNPVDHYL